MFSISLYGIYQALGHSLSPYQPSHDIEQETPSASAPGLINPIQTY